MNIKIENWKLLVLSVFYLVFAILSYTIPAIEFLNFFKVAGIAIVVVGFFQIIIYFMKKDYMKPQGFSFSMGLLLCFGGAIVAVKADLIVDNYPLVIGGCVVLDSILRLQYSMNLLRIQDSQWKLHIALAILPAIMGTVLVLVPLGDMQANYFSFLLIFDGIANIYTILYYRRILKKIGTATEDAIINVGTAEEKQIKGE